MKIIGVIPARYGSSRLEGKPLVDICGKPMIWWVYKQAKKAKGLDEIYVATDDKRIEDFCKNNGMNVVMTSNEHPSHVHRINEFSNIIEADAYVVICGDEPLVEPHVIEAVIPTKIDGEYLIRGAMRELIDPAETIDSANIKIITNKNGQCLSLSRTPIPYPYKSVQLKYKKTIGIECFNKNALDFYCNSISGEWENVEDIMMIRFLENNIPVFFKMVRSNSLSVDTLKDLEKVRKIMYEKIEKGN